MSLRDLVDGEVEVDDEENDDSFDEDTGEVRSRKTAQNGHIDDSSEEEDDDDDEEAARAVCSSLWALSYSPFPIAEILC
jgi:transcription elongation factor SPT6